LIIKNIFIFYIMNNINIIIIGVILLLILVYFTRESFDTISNTCAGPNGAYNILNNSFMIKGDVLPQCSAIKSPDGNIMLVMQSDGNLVTYYTKTNAAIWSSKTNGKGIAPYKFTYQTDGNLVIYDKNYYPIWSSGTYGQSSDVLQLQENGLLVLYVGTPTHTNTTWAGKSIWASQPLMISSPILTSSTPIPVSTSTPHVSTSTPILTTSTSTPPVSTSTPILTTSPVSTSTPILTTSPVSTSTPILTTSPPVSTSTPILTTSPPTSIQSSATSEGDKQKMIDGNNQLQKQITFFNNNIKQMLSERPIHVTNLELSNVFIDYNKHSIEGDVLLHIASY